MGPGSLAGPPGRPRGVARGSPGGAEPAADPCSARGDSRRGRPEAPARPPRAQRVDEPGRASAALPGGPRGGPLRGPGHDDDRRADRLRPRRPALRRPCFGPGATGLAVGPAVDLEPLAGARTAARGIGSRPTSRCGGTCSRRPTRSTTRSARAPRRRWRASSATCCSRSSCTRSSRPRRASST